MEPFIEKQSNNIEDVSHLKVTTEGISDSQEDLNNSIHNEEKRGDDLIQSMGGEAGAEAAFEKLPNEKKQAKIAKLEEKIDSSEALIKGYGSGDNPFKGIQEIRQLLIKARIALIKKF